MMSWTHFPPGTLPFHPLLGTASSFLVSSRNPWRKELSQFLSFLPLSSHVVHLRNDSLAHENSSLRLKFEEKNGECEQIVMVLQRTRNELNKKLEKQQKEYENKISFLIQQLRNTEVRLQENSLLLRSSYDTILEGRRREGEDWKRGEDEEGSKRPHTSSEIISGREEREETKIRPHTGSGADDRRLERGGGDEKEGEEVTGGQSREQEENMKLINDLKRKLDTERHRREILEKRNGEIMRELRRQKERK